MDLSKYHLNLKTFLEASFYGNTLPLWAGSILLVAVLYGLMLGLRKIFIHRFANQDTNSITAAQATGGQRISAALRRALLRTNTVIVLIICCYIATHLLKLPRIIETSIQIITITAALVQAGLWMGGILESWAHHQRARYLITNPSAASAMDVLRLFLHGLVWIGVALLILDNAGINITTLVAGLGIGGIAVALAVQNVLGDIFASVSIVMDKPFAVGDSLTIGEFTGTVESIGLKNTRLRSLSGEQIIIANADLLSSRIRNYGRMYERRVLVTLSVPYQTPRNKLEIIPALIRATIDEQRRTRFDRAHLVRFANSAIEFDYVYYIISSDYIVYMDTQHTINLSLHAAFMKEGIEFAYPTQVVHLQKSKSTQGS